MRKALEGAWILALLALAGMTGALALGERRAATAQTPPPAASDTGVVAILGNAQPGGRNFLWAVRSGAAPGAGDQAQIGLYEQSGQTLTLHSSRNIHYDLQFAQFPGRKDAQRPSVQEAYEATEKARDDARRGR